MFGPKCLEVSGYPPWFGGLNLQGNQWVNEPSWLCFDDDNNNITNVQSNSPFALAATQPDTHIFSHFPTETLPKVKKKPFGQGLTPIPSGGMCSSETLFTVSPVVNYTVAMDFPEIFYQSIVNWSN